MGRTTGRPKARQHGDKTGKALVGSNGAECGAGGGNIRDGGVHFAPPTSMADGMGNGKRSGKGGSLAGGNDPVSSFAHRHVSKAASLRDADRRNANHAGKRR